MAEVFSPFELVLPTKEYETQVMDYKKEFEVNKDSMDGTAGLSNVTSFEEWLSAIIDNSTEKTVRTGLVPASTYLALEKCKDRNMKRVLITCDKENIASAKTILYNDGVLENEVLEEERITQRCWVSLG